MSNVYVSYCNLRIVAFFKYKRCSSHVNTRRVLCIEQALLAICAHDVSFYVSLVCFFFINLDWNRVGGVMVSVLASTDFGWSWVRARSDQTKDYTIGICCFSAKHAAKSKYWLPRNQNNVYEWGDMSIRGLLFQWASTIKIQLNIRVLV
jgi:hypothetical protein